jgi:hypothetical protein
MAHHASHLPRAASSAPSDWPAPPERPSAWAPHLTRSVCQPRNMAVPCRSPRNTRRIRLTASVAIHRAAEGERPCNPKAKRAETLHEPAMCSYGARDSKSGKGQMCFLAGVVHQTRRDERLSANCGEPNWKKSIRALSSTQARWSVGCVTPRYHFRLKHSLACSHGSPIFQEHSFVEARRCKGSPHLSPQTLV